MTGAWDEARVLELARRLKAAKTDGWSGPALRAVVEGLGWEWRDGPDGPRPATGPEPGASPWWTPRLRPTGRFEKDYVHGGEEYVGLYVPVALPEGGAAGKAAAFRTVAEALTEEFGPAPVMGAYGDPGPFYDSAPPWGSPFLRWRERVNTLELHAGEHGPELLLQPTGPVEDWFWRQGHGEHYAVGGFFGSRRVAANAGLGFPGRWRTDDWDVFSHTLGDFLHTLPAETHALGIELDLGFHARVPGTYGPILFHLACGERLEIVYDTEPLGPGIADPGSFGWIPHTTRPAALDHWLEAPYHSGDFGIGEVDGRRLARMMTDTLRALGVPSPLDLSLSDHAQRVGDYHVDYYGLTLQENP
ncbi:MULTISPECIES: hypothetical protein [Streptomyces]|uniref:Uncharacterized protein n=2 Tax=Streptomyces TaxID=1883 RepID=A0A3S9PRK9_STRLT|nr:hypothetical protein [Streptomyces luteoverticillatus]AZQ74953.1 hypothetical protein EKH77_30635 [Streptomyces luteoverticillatus]